MRTGPCVSMMPFKTSEARRACRFATGSPGACVCNSLAVQQDGDKPLFTPVGPLPILGRSLREFLQRLLEPLQRVGLFLVFCILFLLLQRVLLRLLRVLSAGALKIHDHSPLG